MSNLTSVCWLRRDLRLDDHAALYHALKHARLTGGKVSVVFVFDTTILCHLPNDDKRVSFIWYSLRALKDELRAYGSDLTVLHGDPVHEIPRFAREVGAKQVFVNRDYDPAAIARDDAVKQALLLDACILHESKDQVIFEQDEVLTLAKQAFSVFTPYKNAWLKKLNAFYLKAYPVRAYADGFAQQSDLLFPELSVLGFVEADLKLAAGSGGADALLADFVPRMVHYQALRDFPAKKGVSYLSVHLRFGTVSIRRLARLAWEMGGVGADTWLSELIWRDFYHMILWHHPRVVGHAFKPAYDAIVFADDEAGLLAWQRGQTGYPLVDAAMRQLNQTGFMHNRLRMVTACFLVKDLGVDWRRGEAYFAAHLLDFDLAANNGGWQWAASTGCDAQPYFRLFNPITQSEKFDGDGQFIRRYVPELAAVPTKFIHAPWQMPALLREASGLVLGRDYPYPIVDHAAARQSTLARFSVVKTVE